MVVKWFFKAVIGLIAAVVILMFPHKVAGIAVAIAGAIWDIAITIGRALHVPGAKGAVVLPWVGLMFPASKNWFAPLKNEPKEIS